MKKLMAVLIVCAIAVPALVNAAEWKWYASGRGAMWYEMTKDSSKDSSANGVWTWTLKNSNTLYGNSRVGANVKSDAISGKVEIALKNSKTEKLTLRHLYGEWNLSDNASLLIGWTDPPFSTFGGPQEVEGQNGQGGPQGSIGGHSKAMILMLKTNGLKFAILPNSENAQIYKSKVIAVGDTIKTQSYDWSIPEVSANYTMEKETYSFGVNAAFGMLSFKYLTNKDLKTWKKTSATGFAIEGNGSVTISSITVGAGVSYGSNMGVIGLDGYPQSSAVLDAGTVKTMTNIGIPVNVTVKVNENVSIDVGGGYNTATDNSVTTNKTKNAYGAYANAHIKALPGLTIAPEFGYHDQKQVEENTFTYFGIYLQYGL